MPETGPQRDGPTSPRTLLSEVWHRLSNPQQFPGAVLVAVVGGLIVTAVTISLIAPGASEQRAPGASKQTAAPSAGPCERTVEETRVELSDVDSRPLREDARGAATEICRASLWTAPPSLFGLPIERAQDPAFSGLVATSYPPGEAWTASIEEIVREAAGYGGNPIYVVGRIERDDLLEDGETREVRLVGRDQASVAVVRVGNNPFSDVSEGDIVASLVFVAARGTARFTGSDEVVNATYALGDSLEEVSEDFGSRAIREEVRALRRRG